LRVALSTVDWIAIVIVILSALGGARRGLVLSAFSLAGLAAGAYVGSRIGPHFLHGGSSSPWNPLAGLVGAIVGAIVLQTGAAFAGSFVRGGLKLTPFRFVDSLGGLLLGAAIGLAVIWVGGTVALLAPGQTTFRHAVQDSRIVRRLNQAVSPSRLLHLLARIDPFPSISGPAAPSQPPSAAVTGDPAVRAAASRVVRVLGTACGIGIQGSGWFADSDLVVTAAHVVAGERDTIVQIPGEGGSRPADVVAFDAHNDIAVLRVAGVHETPLPLADPQPGASVAILGYPENGALRSTPGRIGRTSVAITQDALGHGPVARTLTAVAGKVQHGNSGGPAIDDAGAVQSTIFAARVGSSSGYGIPASIVRQDLAGAAAQPVSTGNCAG
jgi:S1-C subfamily serine protease